MMRSILHSVLCTMLVLGLAVAGIAQAKAGVAMAATEKAAQGQTEVVICGESGAHVVVLDAGGRPVAKGKGVDCWRCPACAMALAAATPKTPEPMRPVSRARPADDLLFNTPERAGAYGLPVARGPPARA